MKRKLHYLLTRIFDTPLMIHRQKLETVLAVLRPRLPMMFDGEDYPDGTPVDDTPTEADPINVSGKVAVIPIHGILVHRATGMDAMCGMTDYQVLTSMISEASDDPNIEAILLDIDSPGGEAHGCFEFADSIYEARGKKPIVAIVNEMACSAAYAIASAADKVYLTKTGLVGSIGVIATHVDQSKADEMAGLKYTHIFAGKKKADWNEHEPLSERGKAAIQSQVSQMYSIFVSTVARNRGLEPESVAGTEAGLFMGKSAVVAGLADEVIPLSALSEKLQETIQMKPKTANLGAPAAAAPKPSINAEATPPNEEIPPTEEPEEEEGEPEEVPQTPAPKTKKPQVPGASIEETRASAAEIVNMCTIAGQPAMAAEFITSGLTVDQAKARLFDKLASSSSPTLSAVAPNSGGDTEGAELMATAMRALNESQGRRPVKAR